MIFIEVESGLKVLDLLVRGEDFDLVILDM